MVGNNVFNASLVPVAPFSTTNGSSSGFRLRGPGRLPGHDARRDRRGRDPELSNATATQAGAVKPVRMVEAPLLPVNRQPQRHRQREPAPAREREPGTGTWHRIGNRHRDRHGALRSAPTPIRLYPHRGALPSAGTVVVLTTSGFTVLAANYDASVAPPAISSVVNAADGTQPVAPGGLISAYGQQMSPVNMATSQIPLPTALGDSCLSVNGAPVPLLFVSSQQINAQLPFNVTGNATLNIHSPGGHQQQLLFHGARRRRRACSERERRVR